MVQSLSPKTRRAVMAYAAAHQTAGGPIVTTPTVYDVAKPTYPPTNPTFIQLMGGVNRAAVRFDTGNASIGTKPVEGQG